MNEFKIKEIAKTSCINMDVEEENLILKEIEKVIEYLGKYDALTGKSLDSPSMTFDDAREDKPGTSLTLEEALKNTSTRKYSYFQVKEFVEK